MTVTTIARSLRAFAAAWLLVILAAGSAFAASRETPFSFEMVVAKARALAQEPYAPESDPLPEFFRNLDYSGFGEIRFNDENILWRKEKGPFAVAFFHRGYLFTKKVTVNTVEKGAAKEVLFSENYFNYQKSAYPHGKLPKDLGFGGFVLFHPYEQGGEYRECMVFLGASYFRVKGRDMEYGLSARGLAIDTVLPSGEEFPYFREFWIVKPEKDAESITVYALMNSPSVSGAYRFDLTPGETPVVDVQSRVFARADIEKVGVAPLTSMFWYGENTGRFPKDARFIDDFRPEVHDSDTLLMHTGAGEWLLRPLVNPKSILVNTFTDENPRGFGLLQRDTNVWNYQDIEAVYHLRPSAWVEPKGDWGQGRVELVQIPTDAEIYDNIVSYWTPREKVRAGDALSFDYRLTYFNGLLPGVPPAGYVLATHQMRGGMCGSEPCRDAVPGTRLFVVDFAGGELPDLPANAPVEAVISLSEGSIAKLITVKNRFMAGWRVYFEVAPPEGEPRPIEMRAYLKRGDDILTETWSYAWMRD